MLAEPKATTIITQCIHYNVACVKYRPIELYNYIMQLLALCAPQCLGQ